MHMCSTNRVNPIDQKKKLIQDYSARGREGGKERDLMKCLPFVEGYSEWGIERSKRLVVQKSTKIGTKLEDQNYKIC